MKPKCMTVSDFIKLSNMYNEIVDLYTADPANPMERVRFWSGMEWELLELPLAHLTFDRLFGAIPESIYSGDHILIQVKEAVTVYRDGNGNIKHDIAYESEPIEEQVEVEVRECECT